MLIKFFEIFFTDVAPKVLSSNDLSVCCNTGHSLSVVVCPACAFIFGSLEEIQLLHLKEVGFDLTVHCLEG